MSLVLTETNAAGLMVITLNRPEKMNALSLALMAELQSAIAIADRGARANSVRAVVCKSSTAKAFCVGADLSERLVMNSDQVSATLTAQRKIMDAVASIPVPTFALIEGAAFGGGLELALACDFRFAAPSATMGLTETRLAIIPGAGGTQRLPRLIGENKAKELIFTGRRISGSEAAAIGLVNACVDKPMELAERWFAEISQAGPVAIRAAKKSIEGGLGLDLPEALDFERACYDLVLATEDRTEGLDAFSQKRPPKYRGR